MVKVSQVLYQFRFNKLGLNHKLILVFFIFVLSLNISKVNAEGLIMCFLENEMSDVNSQPKETCERVCSDAKAYTIVDDSCLLSNEYGAGCMCPET